MHWQQLTGDGKNRAQCPSDGSSLLKNEECFWMEYLKKLLLDKFHFILNGWNSPTKKLFQS